VGRVEALPIPDTGAAARG